MPEAAHDPVPMTPMDENGVLADPLTVAIAHAFEVYDLDAIEAQDGDMLRGLARLAAYTAKQPFRLHWAESVGLILLICIASAAVVLSAVNGQW